jgi:hypothetical protein
MIQRIQSIFLLLIAVCAGLSFISNAWTGQEAAGTLTVSNWQVQYTSALSTVVGTEVAISSPTQSTWYCGALAITCGLLAAWTLFSFRDRVTQNKLSMAGSAMSLLWLVAYVVAVNKAKSSSLALQHEAWGLSAAMALASIILFQVAAFFIRKDEALVRSADRIR